MKELKRIIITDFLKIKSIMRINALIEFHSKNKYLFMTYNKTLLQRLGNIVANRESLNIDKLFNLYEAALEILFINEPTKNNQINTLQHIFGYFKNNLSDEDKSYYFNLQEQFKNNQTTYSNILSLLYEWSTIYKQEYLLKQTIFLNITKN